MKYFNHIFKMIDTEHVGKISSLEFIKLVEMANIYYTREELEIKTKMMIKE